VNDHRLALRQCLICLNRVVCLLGPQSNRRYMYFQTLWRISKSHSETMRVDFQLRAGRPFSFSSLPCGLSTKPSQKVCHLARHTKFCFIFRRNHSGSPYYHTAAPYRAEWLIPALCYRPHSVIMPLLNSLLATLIEFLRRFEEGSRTC